VSLAVLLISHDFISKFAAKSLGAWTLSTGVIAFPLSSDAECVS